MKTILRNLKTAVLVSISMFVICGIIYPLAMTGISQVLFPYQANGSLVEKDGEIVGSMLVGQDFTDDRLFHCRPSAYNYNTYTLEDKSNKNYSGIASGGYNYAASNPELKKRIEDDINKFLKENPTISKEDIPSDIITASGSGLDPHISIEAAQVQVDRVSKNTSISKERLNEMIKESTETKFLGIFGEDTVNVLKINLEIANEISLD